MRFTLGGIAVIFLALIGFSIAWGFWFTIGQSERGILTRYGAIIGDPLQPGLHGKLPWIESYHVVSVATDKAVYEDMESYSKDQQPAHFRISVIYHIPPDKVQEVYWRYGGEAGLLERVLDRHVPQQAKNVFGQYDAISVIQTRAQFNKDVADAITNAVKGDPIIIEGVQVEDVQFSEDYIAAVKARMIAEVQVQQLKQTEEQQKVNAEITVINADASAKARVAQATADAKAIQLAGEAQAAAIEAQAKALAQNPGLVLLRQAEKWDGKLPTQMIPNSALPFLSLQPQGVAPSGKTTINGPIP